MGYGFSVNIYKIKTYNIIFWEEIQSYDI
jgi:hypothetical protein